MKDVRLAGWGLTPHVKTQVATPHESEVSRYLLKSPCAIARGLGRAYGDSAVCAEGVTLISSSIDSISQVVDGRVVVGAGVSLDALLREIIPQGWFVPRSNPGTPQFPGQRS